MFFRKAKRLFSFLTLCLYLFSEILRADPSLIHTASALGGDVENKPYFSIEIPAELGKVEALRMPKPESGAPFIIHVQTIHGDHETAVKIRDILHFLKTQYGTNLIFAEGAGEKLHPELLEFLSDREANEQVLSALAEEGELTGVDLALSSREFEAVGIEDARLYGRAYRLFKEVIGNLDESEKALGRARLELEKEASKIFGNELRDLTGYWLEFYSGKRNPLASVRYLSGEAKTVLDLDFENPFSQFEWPQMTRLYLLQELEARRDAAKLEIEKKKLKAWLAAKNLSPELIKMVPGTSRDRFPEPVPSVPGTIQGTVRAQAENFLRAAEPSGFQFKDYPEITYSTAAKILQQELDAKVLFREFDRLFETLFSKIIRTDAEQALVDSYKNLRQVQDLLRLELTAEDWKEMKDSLIVIPAEAGIQHTKPTLDSRFRGNDRNEFDHDTLRSAIHFYHLMERRDRAFWKKISTGITPGKPGGKSPSAILVTGGFHAERMKQFFEKQGYGYALITPHVSGFAGSSTYRKIMMRSSHMEKALLPQTRSKLETLVGVDGGFFRGEMQNVIKAHAAAGLAYNRNAPYFRDRQMVPGTIQTLLVTVRGHDGRNAEVVSPYTRTNPIFSRFGFSAGALYNLLSGFTPAANLKYLRTRRKPKPPRSEVRDVSAEQMQELLEDIEKQLLKIGIPVGRQFDKKVTGRKRDELLQSLLAAPVLDRAAAREVFRRAGWPSLNNQEADSLIRIVAGVKDEAIQKASDWDSIREIIGTAAVGKIVSELKNLRSKFADMKFLMTLYEDISEIDFKKGSFISRFALKKDPVPAGFLAGFPEAVRKALIEKLQLRKNVFSAMYSQVTLPGVVHIQEKPPLMQPEEARKLLSDMARAAGIPAGADLLRQFDQMSSPQARERSMLEKVRTSNWADFEKYFMEGVRFKIPFFGMHDAMNEIIKGIDPAADLTPALEEKIEMTYSAHLRAYSELTQAHRNDLWNEEEGRFVYTLTRLEDALEIISRLKDVLKPGVRFGDLGSGDGFVVHLVRLLTGAESTGIDVLDFLIQKSEEVTAELVARGVFAGESGIEWKKLDYESEEADLSQFDVLYIYPPKSGAPVVEEAEEETPAPAGPDESGKQVVRVKIPKPVTEAQPTVDFLTIARKMKPGALLVVHGVDPRWILAITGMPEVLEYVPKLLAFRRKETFRSEVRLPQSGGETEGSSAKAAAEVRNADDNAKFSETLEDIHLQLENIENVRESLGQLRKLVFQKNTGMADSPEKRQAQADILVSLLAHPDKGVRRGAGSLIGAFENFPIESLIDAVRKPAVSERYEGMIVDSANRSFQPDTGRLNMRLAAIFAIKEFITSSPVSSAHMPQWQKFLEMNPEYLKVPVTMKQAGTALLAQEILKSAEVLSLLEVFRAVRMLVGDLAYAKEAIEKVLQTMPDDFQRAVREGRSEVRTEVEETPQVFVPESVQSFEKNPFPAIRRLGEWISRQRWFMEKENEIRGIEYVDAFIFGEKNGNSVHGLIVKLRILSPDGNLIQKQYFIPVIVSQAPPAGMAPDEYVSVRLNDGERYLSFAEHQSLYQKILMRYFHEGHSVGSWNQGRVVFTAFDKTLKEMAGDDLNSESLGVSTSNVLTRVQAADHTVVSKTYKDLRGPAGYYAEWPANTEVSKYEALYEAGYTHMPRVHGVMEYVSSNGRRTALGLMMEAVNAETEAGGIFWEGLSRFMRTLKTGSGGDADTAAENLITGAGTIARELAETVSGMHSAFLKSGRPGFRASPASLSNIRHLEEVEKHHLDEAIESLKQRMNANGGSPGLKRFGVELGKRLQSLADARTALRSLEGTLMIASAHGDLSTAQGLIEKVEGRSLNQEFWDTAVRGSRSETVQKAEALIDRVRWLDFEGRPAKEPVSAGFDQRENWLKDVAGILEGFWYIANLQLYDSLGLNPRMNPAHREDARTASLVLAGYAAPSELAHLGLNPAIILQLNRWVSETTEAFLESYFDAVEVAGVENAVLSRWNRAAARGIVDHFMLERAIHEFQYEFYGREWGWEAIPGTRMLQLVDSGRLAQLSAPAVTGAAETQNSIFGGRLTAVDFPAKEFFSPVDAGKPVDGIFLPFHHMRHADDWGVGNFYTAKFAGDFAHELGYHIIQDLPQTYSSAGNSPYSVLSALLLDPLYLSAPEVVRMFERAGISVAGWQEFLESNREKIEALKASPQIQHEAIAELNLAAMRLAWAALQENKTSPVWSQFQIFLTRNEELVKDDLLYRQLKIERGDDWRRWEEGVRDRDPAALESARERLAPELEFQAFVQFILAHQKNERDQHYRKINISSMVDMAFAPPNAEIWKNPAVVGMKKENGYRRDAVQGVPGKKEAPVGQLWNFSVYDWSNPAAVALFLKVYKINLERADYLRADHALALYRIFVFLQKGFTLRELGLEEKIRTMAEYGNTAGNDLEKGYAVQAVNAWIRQAVLEKGEALGLDRGILGQIFDGHGHIQKGGNLILVARKVPAEQHEENLPEGSRWQRWHWEEDAFYDGEPKWDVLRLTPNERAQDDGDTWTWLFPRDGREGPKPDDQIRFGYFRLSPGEAVMSELQAIAQERGKKIIFETLGTVPPVIQSSSSRFGINYYPLVYGMDPQSWYHPLKIKTRNGMATFNVADTGSPQSAWSKITDWNNIKGPTIRRFFPRMPGHEFHPHMMGVTPEVHEKLLQMVYYPQGIYHEISPEVSPLIALLGLIDIANLPEKYRLNIPGLSRQWANKLPEDLSLENLLDAALGNPASRMAQDAVSLVSRLQTLRSYLDPYPVNPKSLQVMRTEPDIYEDGVQIRRIGGDDAHPFFVEASIAGTPLKVEVVLRSAEGMEARLDMQPVESARGGIEGSVNWGAAFMPSVEGIYEARIEIEYQKGKRLVAPPVQLIAVREDADLNPLSPGYVLTPDYRAFKSAAVRSEVRPTFGDVGQVKRSGTWRSEVRTSELSEVRARLRRHLRNQLKGRAIDPSKYIYLTEHQPYRILAARNAAGKILGFAFGKKENRHIHSVETEPGREPDGFLTEPHANGIRIVTYEEENGKKYKEDEFILGRFGDVYRLKLEMAGGLPMNQSVEYHNWMPSYMLTKANEVQAIGEILGPQLYEGLRKFLPADARLVLAPGMEPESRMTYWPSVSGVIRSREEVFGGLDHEGFDVAHLRYSNGGQEQLPEGTKIPMLVREKGIVKWVFQDNVRSTAIILTDLIAPIGSQRMYIPQNSDDVSRIKIEPGGGVSFPDDVKVDIVESPGERYRVALVYTHLELEDWVKPGAEVTADDPRTIGTIERHRKYPNSPVVPHLHFAVMLFKESEIAKYPVLDFPLINSKLGPEKTVLYVNSLSLLKTGERQELFLEGEGAQPGFHSLGLIASDETSRRTMRARISHAFPGIPVWTAVAGEGDGKPELVQSDVVIRQTPQGWTVTASPIIKERLGTFDGAAPNQEELIQKLKEIDLGLRGVIRSEVRPVELMAKSRQPSAESRMLKAESSRKRSEVRSAIDEMGRLLGEEAIKSLINVSDLRKTPVILDVTDGTLQAGDITKEFDDEFAGIWVELLEHGVERLEVDGELLQRWSVNLDKGRAEFKEMLKSAASASPDEAVVRVTDNEILWAVLMEGSTVKVQVRSEVRSDSSAVLEQTLTNLAELQRPQLRWPNPAAAPRHSLLEGADRFYNVPPRELAGQIYFIHPAVPSETGSGTEPYVVTLSFADAADGEPSGQEKRVHYRLYAVPLDSFGASEEWAGLTDTHRPDYAGNILLRFGNENELQIPEVAEINTFPHFPWLRDFLKTELSKQVGNTMNASNPGLLLRLRDLSDLLAADPTLAKLNDLRPDQFKNLFFQAYAARRAWFVSRYREWMKKSSPEKRVRGAGTVIFRKIDGEWKFLMGRRPDDTKVHPGTFTVPVGKADQETDRFVRVMDRKRMRTLKQLRILLDQDEDPNADWEAVAEAAARETYEETGIFLRPGDFAGRVDDFWGYSNDVLVSLFIFVDHDTSPEIEETSEFSQSDWVSLRDFLSVEQSETGAAVEKILRGKVADAKIMPELRDTGMPSLHSLLHQVLDSWVPEVRREEIVSVKIPWYETLAKIFGELWKEYDDSGDPLIQIDLKHVDIPDDPEVEITGGVVKNREGKFGPFSAKNPVLGWEAMLYQAVTEIITNAREASAEPEAVKIQVRAGRENGNVFLDIRDNGEGIDDEIVRTRLDDWLSESDGHFLSSKAVSNRGRGLVLISSFIREAGGKVLIASAKPDSGDPAKLVVSSILLEPGERVYQETYPLKDAATATANSGTLVRIIFPVDHGADRPVSQFRWPFQIVMTVAAPRSEVRPNFNKLGQERPSGARRSEVRSVIDEMGGLLGEEAMRALADVFDLRSTTVTLQVPDGTMQAGSITKEFDDDFAGIWVELLNHGVETIEIAGELLQRWSVNLDKGRMEFKEMLKSAANASPDEAVVRITDNEILWAVLMEGSTVKVQVRSEVRQPTGEIRPDGFRQDFGRMRASSDEPALPSLETGRFEGRIGPSHSLDDEGAKLFVFLGDASEYAADITTIRLNPQDLERIRAVFQDPATHQMKAGSPEEEKVLLHDGILLYLTDILPGKLRKDGPNGPEKCQNCFDYARTTSVFIHFIQTQGWLRFYKLYGYTGTRHLGHHIAVTVARDVPVYDLSNYPWTQIQETPERLNEMWVIDSWVLDYGEPLVIMPLTEWPFDNRHVLYEPDAAVFESSNEYNTNETAISANPRFANGSENVKFSPNAKIEQLYKRIEVQRDARVEKETVDNLVREIRSKTAPPELAVNYRAGYLLMRDAPAAGGDSKTGKINQAKDHLRLSGANEQTQSKVNAMLDKLMNHPEADALTLLQFEGIAHRIVSRHSGNASAYKGYKKRLDNAFLEIYPGIRGKVMNIFDSENRLKAALIYAGIGNLIDPSHPDSLQKIAADLNLTINTEGPISPEDLDKLVTGVYEKISGGETGSSPYILGQEDFVRLRDLLEQNPKGSILYFTDNHGEFIMDQLVFEVLLERGIKVGVVSRNENVRDDITEQEARAILSDDAYFSARLNEGTLTTMSDGSYLLGADLTQSGHQTAFVEAWKKAAGIIAKGAGNFHTLPGQQLSLPLFHIRMMKGSKNAYDRLGVLKGTPASKQSDYDLMFFYQDANAVRSEVRSEGEKPFHDPLRALRDPELKAFIREMHLANYRSLGRFFPNRAFPRDIARLKITKEEKLAKLMDRILDALAGFEGDSLDAARKVNAEIFDFQNHQGAFRKALQRHMKTYFEADWKAEQGFTDPFYLGPVLADVGAGYGRFLTLLADRSPPGKFSTLIGTDPYDYAEEYAKGDDRLTFIRQTGENVPVDAVGRGTVNTVHLGSVIHHTYPAFENPQDPEARRNVISFLKSIYDTLAPGGRVVIHEDSYPEKASPDYAGSPTLSASYQPELTERFMKLTPEQKYQYLVWNDWYWNILASGLYGMSMPYRYYSMEDWSSIFEEAGFRVVEKQYWGFRRTAYHGASTAFFEIEKPRRSEIIPPSIESLRKAHLKRLDRRKKQIIYAEADDIDGNLTSGDSVEVPEDMILKIQNDLLAGKIRALVSGRAEKVSARQKARGIHDIEEVAERIRAGLEHTPEGREVISNLILFPENGTYAVWREWDESQKRFVRKELDLARHYGKVTAGFKLDKLKRDKLDQELIQYLKVQGFKNPFKAREDKRYGFASWLNDVEHGWSAEERSQRANAMTLKIKDFLAEHPEYQNYEVVATSVTVDVGVKGIAKPLAVRFLQDRFGLKANQIASFDDKAATLGNGYGFTERVQGYSTNEYDPESRHQVSLALITGRKNLEARRKADKVLKFHHLPSTLKINAKRFDSTAEITSRFVAAKKLAKTQRALLKKTLLEKAENGEVFRLSDLVPLIGVSESILIPAIRGLGEDENGKHELVLRDGGWTSILQIIDEEGNPTGEISDFWTVKKQRLLTPSVTVLIQAPDKRIAFQVNAKQGFLDASAGGQVDLGLTPEQAALKELHEEIGLTGISENRLIPIKNPLRGSGKFLNYYGPDIAKTGFDPQGKFSGAPRTKPGEFTLTHRFGLQLTADEFDRLRQFTGSEEAKTIEWLRPDEIQFVNNQARLASGKEYPTPEELTSLLFDSRVWNSVIGQLESARSEVRPTPFGVGPEEPSGTWRSEVRDVANPRISAFTMPFIQASLENISQQTAFGFALGLESPEWETGVAQDYRLALRRAVEAHYRERGIPVTRENVPYFSILQTEARASDEPVRVVRIYDNLPPIEAPEIQVLIDFLANNRQAYVFIEAKNASQQDLARLEGDLQDAVRMRRMKKMDSGEAADSKGVNLRVVSSSDAYWKEIKAVNLTRALVYGSARKQLDELYSGLSLESRSQTYFVEDDLEQSADPLKEASALLAALEDLLSPAPIPPGITSARDLVSRHFEIERQVRELVARSA